MNKTLKKQGNNIIDVQKEGDNKIYKVDKRVLKLA